MKYSDFKRLRSFGKDEKNKPLLDKISSCEDILGVCAWLKSNENKDSEGKPLYKASITLNIHGRGEDDADEKDIRTLSYDTNFDFIEKKVNDMYGSLLKEFEDKTN